jgi:cell division protein DivIC
MQRSNPLGGVFPFRTFAIVVAVVLVVLFGFALGNLVISGYQLNAQAAHVRAAIAALKVENARLQERVRYLQSDGAVEALAREQLGWIRPGDTAIVVVARPGDTLPPPSLPAPAPSPQAPNWVRWMKFLLGN